MEKKQIIGLCALLFVANSLHCGVGAGFSKIWEGTKDVVAGTYHGVASLFRGKKADDRRVGKEKKKKKMQLKKKTKKK